MINFSSNCTLRGEACRINSFSDIIFIKDMYELHYLPCVIKKVSRLSYIINKGCTLNRFTNAKEKAKLGDVIARLYGMKVGKK